jgi:hypothetical protein
VLSQIGFDVFSTQLIPGGAQYYQQNEQGNDDRPGDRHYAKPGHQTN